VSKAFKAMTFVEDWLSGLLILAAALMNCANVILRYIFESPLNFVYEVSVFMIIAAVFIAVGSAFRKDKHIRVGILYSLIPTRYRKYLKMVADCIVFLFSLFLIWQGLRLVLLSQSRGTLSIDVGIPLYLVYALIPLGAVLAGFAAAQGVYSALIKNTQDNTEEKMGEQR